MFVSVQYFYGMRLRGFAPMCQPKEGFVGLASEETVKAIEAEKYHDVLVYDRKLTDDELRDYELDYLGICY